MIEAPCSVVKRVFITLLVPLAISAAASSGAQAATPPPPRDPKTDYKVAVAQAEADYKVAKARCDSLGGNPREVCTEEARAKEKRAKAEAKARYEGTPKAREQARVAAVDGDYDVAKARCGTRAGEARKACEAEAKAVRARAVADIMAGKR